MCLVNNTILCVIGRMMTFKRFSTSGHQQCHFRPVARYSRSNSVRVSVDGLARKLVLVSRFHWLGPHPPTLHVVLFTFALHARPRFDTSSFRGTSDRFLRARFHDMEPVLNGYCALVLRCHFTVQRSWDRRHVCGFCKFVSLYSLTCPCDAADVVLWSSLGSTKTPCLFFAVSLCIAAVCVRTHWCCVKAGRETLSDGSVDSGPFRRRVHWLETIAATVSDTSRQERFHGDAKPPHGALSSTALRIAALSLHQLDDCLWWNRELCMTVAVQRGMHGSSVRQLSSSTNLLCRHVVQCRNARTVNGKGHVFWQIGAF